MRKILVLRGGALGDFIVTFPALASLRQRWPGSRIELVGNATAAALAAPCATATLLDAVHSQSEARWAALYGEQPLPAAMRAWLAEFDLVLNYWPDPEGELRRRFPAGAEQIFLSTDAMPTKAPAAAHYCEPLRALGIEPAGYFYPLDSFANSAERQQTIAIHPGSGSPRKNWPLKRWSALAGWLQREHAAELLIVTGEAENESRDPLRGMGRELHARPLRELAAALAKCRFFLGHDSGVSHLAAACGVPSLLLFGPTDPAMWAPPAPHVRVLRRGPALESLALAEVQTAVATMLKQ